MFAGVFHEIRALGLPSVSAEVVTTDVEGKPVEGRRRRALQPLIYVKVPMAPAGWGATKTLAEEGTRVNMISSSPPPKRSSRPSSVRPMSVRSSDASTIRARTVWISSATP